MPISRKKTEKLIKKLIEKLIKEYVSKSPETFFSISTYSTKPNQELICPGSYRQTPLYKRIKRFLSKLIQCAYLDYYQEKKLKNLLHNKGASFDVDTEEKLKKDFKKAFKVLTDKWPKFQKKQSVTTNFKYVSCTIPSSRNYDFSWEIFKVIYSEFPQLCEKIFPVVLFIIADFYYEFCKICYIKNEGQNLPDTPSSADKEKILATFKKIVSGKKHNIYLFSLLDKKAKYYTESSFSCGEKIYNQHKEDYRKKYKWVKDKYGKSKSNKIIDDQCSYYIGGFIEKNGDYYYGENFEINIGRNERAWDKVIQDMDCKNKENETMERIKSLYRNRLSQKQKDRSEYLADTPIVPGENFHAVQYFLDEFKSNNAWGKYDAPLTLYSINMVTGWYDALFLSNAICKTKEIQSNTKMLMTIRVLAILSKSGSKALYMMSYLSHILEDEVTGKLDNKPSRSHFFLKAIELCLSIKSDFFKVFYKTVSDKENEELSEDIHDMYCNIVDYVYENNKFNEDALFLYLALYLE